MCFPFLTPYIAPVVSESDTEDEEDVCVLCGEDDAILFDLCEDCEEVVEPAKCDGCDQTIQADVVFAALAITFLLDVANTALQTALTRDDVVGAYAGLRPLIDAEGRTSDLSRDHAVLESGNGLFSVVGGKLTEYRLMAKDVLDRAVSARGLAAGPCRTGDLPLVGAPANPVSTLRATGDLPGSLVARYGAESPTVLASARCARPTEPVADGIDVTRAEFEFAVTHEGALDAGDILDRRTRIGLVAADRERAAGAAEEFLAAAH